MKKAHILSLSSYTTGSISWLAVGFITLMFVALSFEHYYAQISQIREFAGPNHTRNLLINLISPFLLAFIINIICCAGKKRPFIGTFKALIFLVLLLKVVYDLIGLMY